jgi:integrase
MRTTKRRSTERKKLPPGLVWRGETIHIDTTINARQVRQTTKTDSVKKAWIVLENLRNLTGKPEDLQKLWGEAVHKFFSTTTHKDRVEQKAKIQRMRKFIPIEMPVNQIFNSTLDPMREELIGKGRKASTVNSYLKLVGQILSNCLKWEDAGVSWLSKPHNIRLESTKRNPIPAMNMKPGYILSWEEQDKLFANLPSHLKDAALYAVNTGAREGEVSNLRWSWEGNFPDLGVKAFRIPGEFHKNGKPKLVVLNSIAREIIEKKRGEHPEFVFTYKGSKIRKFNASAWRKNRARMGMSHVTFHDLRHTFATRLDKYGLRESEIALLMGHTIDGVTAGYAFTTQAVEPMVVNVEKLVTRRHFTFIRAEQDQNPTKTPQSFQLCE